MIETKRILVVDDQEANRVLLRSMLKTIGYDSELAHDGLDALAKLKSDIDLVLLDIMMPGIDGFEVARRIRDDPDCGDVPIIMVTVLGSKDDRLRAVESGANDFISKPLDQLELRVRMASLLRMKEAQDLNKRHRVELEVMVENRTAALKESEARLRSIFETAQDCIFIKDRDLRYTHVNPAMEKLFQLPASKLVGQTDEHIFGSEAGNQTREVDRRVLSGEFIEEEQTRPVNGIPATFHEIRSPMRDPSGHIIGLCGIARNVTDRKRAGAAPIAVVSRYPSKAMRVTLADASTGAKSDSIVLLTGESGCGKDHLARYIHNHSKRSTGPFFSINCAAVPPDLAESELFGHETGAFTGAVRRKRGLLELAEGGTLLLNEIAELPMWVQAKLLTFLDSRSFTRVGGEKKISVSARLIAATNKDLEKAVNEGRFRDDLFYRLNVLSIKVPPLRDRIEDIPILINSIMSELGSAMQLKVLPEVDAATVERLCQYHWPGNVRELRNVLERSLIHSKEGKLEMRLPELQENSPREWSWIAAFPPQQSFNGTVKDLKRSLIEEALRRSSGKRNEAATLLGITRAALKRQMKTLGFFGPE